MKFRDEGDRRRALSKDMPIVEFEKLKIGDRIHFNSGWPQTSWTAEVRSEPVDGEVVVLFKSAPAYGRYRYDLLTRIEAMVATSGDTRMLRVGPLPREICQRDGD